MVQVVAAVAVCCIIPPQYGLEPLSIEWGLCALFYVIHCSS